MATGGSDAFLTALSEVQDHLARDSGNANPYAAAEGRREEARLVRPCVERFVRGEMDPTRALTVARGTSIGPLGAPPSLAEKLGRRLETANSATVDRTAFAVNKAIAIGYVMAIDTETNPGKVQRDRTLEDVWRYWMLSCRIMLEDVGYPKEWAKTVRGMGADLLVGELKALGLTRLLGGSKLNQLGLLYAQAGAQLRFAQTDDTPERVFVSEVERSRSIADPLPWTLDD